LSYFRLRVELNAAKPFWFLKSRHQASALMTACGLRSVTLSNTSVALPVPQRGGGKADAGGKLLLGHAHLGAHGFDVDGARTLHVRISSRAIA